MARFDVSFFSQTLQTDTQMTVLLPDSMNDIKSGDLPVLYLLHGLNGNYQEWTRFTSLERYVKNLPLITVMAEGTRSFYQDMAYGGAYFQFNSVEVPDFIESCFPAGKSREKRFVAGLSMGGFGAFKMALNRPERYAAACSFSGVLDFPLLVRETRLDPDLRRNRIFDACFGAGYNGDSAAGTENDLAALLKHYIPGTFPRLYQTCGTEDFLYPHNCNFREACNRFSVPVVYSEGPGAHEWDYWDRVLPWFLNQLPL